MRAYPVHNPAVTQETIGTTICVPGWTRGARPSSSYARRVKIGLVRELEIPGICSAISNSITAFP